MKNSFFDFLSWIVKAEKEKPEIPKNVGYMSNRWLSMASKPIAQIVNATTNRWNFSDEEVLANFYHLVIPKYTKRINYIKKQTHETEDEIENVEFLCSSMEISKRELQNYNNTLAELNINDN